MSAESCLNDCTDGGECDDGTCKCDDLRAGDDCALKLCPDNCSGNGVCSVEGTDMTSDFSSLL